MKRDDWINRFSFIHSPKAFVFWGAIMPCHAIHLCPKYINEYVKELACVKILLSKVSFVYQYLHKRGVRSFFLWTESSRESHRSLAAETAVWNFITIQTCFMYVSLSRSLACEFIAYIKHRLVLSLCSQMKSINLPHTAAELQHQ